MIAASNESCSPRALPSTATLDGRDITEDAATSPINPYGRTKLIGEWAIRDFASAHNFAYAILRYFNVAGTAHPNLADTNSTNLIPQVVRALQNNEAPLIYGTDYDTPDGTCVRDFVDVRDLAVAHVDAIDLIEYAKHQTLNVGSGHGYSVQEVITQALSIAGSRLQPRRLPRRAGDPASVVAGTRRIIDTTGWRPRRHLSEIITSTMQPQLEEAMSVRRPNHPATWLN